MELGSPEHWQLKGEGNANLVFGYTGDLSHLVGTVLRVRKPQPSRPDEQQALEDLVWGPVLGAGPPAAAARSSGAPTPPAPAAAAAVREQRYVQQLLAPLLGAQHIPPQRPVRPSAAFLRCLLENSGRARASSNGGSTDEAVAAAEEAAALMPDVTLLPPAGPPSLQQPPAAQQQQTQQQEAQQQGCVPTGPVVCVELKPKCGFVTSCGTVHPTNRDLKHSRSRYQLHQLLKLSQGKVDACSAYDPCDLFSGEPLRLRTALSALLAQPQNNLLLFLDGRRQALVGQQPQAARRARGGAGAPVEQQQERQKEQQQQPEQQQQQQDPAGALEELLAGLLPLPAAERRCALVELLAAVLEREGVLPRLLAAQRQCGYDVEGVHRLYCHLAGLKPDAAEQAEAAAAAAAAERERAEEEPVGGPSSSSINGGSDDDATARHAQAVSALLALPAAEAHNVLRAYVVAATAKDCAIMVALQRLVGAPPTAAAAAAEQQPQPEQQQLEGWTALQPSCICCPTAAGDGPTTAACSSNGSSGAGTWFRYRLCLVDLDQKPLAKIPTHAALDARILAAARRHLKENEAGGSGEQQAAGDVLHPLADP